LVADQRRLIAGAGARSVAETGAAFTRDREIEALQTAAEDSAR